MDELDELRAEMIDRFGPMPNYALSLFRCAQIKLRAADLGIRKIDAGAASGYATGGPVGAVVGGALGAATGAVTGTANMLTPPPAR